MDKITQIAVVAIHVLIQLIQPFLRLVIRRYLRYQTKRIETVHFVNLQRMVDLVKEMFVRHIDIGA